MDKRNKKRNYNLCRVLNVPLTPTENAACSCKDNEKLGI